MNAPAIGNVHIPSLQMAEEELIRVLETSVYPGAKLDSIKLAIGYCRGNQLDPMTKPVHIVPMNVKKAGTKDQYEWRDVIMPGIELYRTKAARTDEYVGIDEATFGPDVNNDAEVGITYPQWCSVTVYRLIDGQPRAFSSGKVFWRETYATAGRDTPKPNAMWKKRPYGQLEKCAEAMALRRAFPEIGAEPTREEMEGKVIDGGDAVVERVPLPGPQSKSAPPPPPPRPEKKAERDDPPAEKKSNGNGDSTPAPAGQIRIIESKLKAICAIQNRTEQQVRGSCLAAHGLETFEGITVEQGNAILNWINKETNAQGQE